MFQESLRRSLWQAPLLMIAAGLVAIGVNHWRSDGLPLVGDWSEEARSVDAAGKRLVIGLDEAAGLFERQAALILDARPHNQYAEGHILGAVSLPWQEADRYFMDLAERLEGAPMIITYCDGESCDLSHQLALFLKEMGFESVRVLVNGWSLWRQAGLPTQVGG